MAAVAPAASVLARARGNTLQQYGREENAGLNPKLARLLAVAALALAAAAAIWQLRRTQVVPVSLQFPLHRLEWRAEAQPGRPPERLTSDKLLDLRFELRLEGERAAQGGWEFGDTAGNAPAAVQTPPLELRRGEYALALKARFRGFDGQDQHASRIQPLRVDTEGAMQVRLEDQIQP